MKNILRHENDRFGMDVFITNGDNAGSSYQTYLLDGIPTIGVKKGETFGIRIYNKTGARSSVTLSVDGRNPVTSKEAIDGYTDDGFIVPARRRPVEVKCWLEDSEKGAEFIFGDGNFGVAKYTDTEDTSAVGYIGALPFTEGYSVPQFMVQTRGAAPRSGTKSVFGDAIPKGAIPKGAITKSATPKTAEPEPSLAAGMGATIDHGFHTVEGLKEPLREEMLRIRYLPYDVLVQRLQECAHPTGFKKPEPVSMGDYSRVPRQTGLPVPAADPVGEAEFPRFCS